MNAAIEDRTPRSSGETRDNRGRERKKKKGKKEEKMRVFESNSHVLRSNVSSADMLRRYLIIDTIRLKLKLAPKAESWHFKFKADCFLHFKAHRRPSAEPYVGQHDFM